ncbi:MAG: TonB-dependent receptor [Melioribacteraceae bacterium]|nr:TonB-dependent receptor [Melioribacteraceae bacterium]
MNQSRITYIILLLQITFSVLVSAQSKIKISGTIYDNTGNPLPYVNVYIKNSLDGAMSDEKGDFNFKTNPGSEIILIASMIGFETFEEKIEPTEKENIKVALEPKVIEFEETVVTGSSFSSVKEKGLVVSQMDVYTTPGGTGDVFQTLKTLPGITQVSESAELYVRGGDPHETITIIDQASVYHPYTYESSYGGLFSNLNTAAVDGLYFSSGGFSAKYGNALSGVLDIKTKDEPENLYFNIGFSMAHATVNADIPIIDNSIGLRFYSQQSFTKPLMWLNGTDDEFSQTPRARNISTSLLLKYSNTGRIKISGIFAEDAQGVDINRAEFDGTFSGNTNNRLINIQHTDLLLKNGLIKTSLSYSSHINKWHLGSLNIKMKDSYYKIRSDYEKTFTSRLKLLAGFEIENREEQFIGSIPQEDFNMRADAPINIFDESVKNNRYGIYSEFEIARPLGMDDFSLSAGIRSDYFSRTDQYWFDPRFSLGYKISYKSTAKLGAGIFHQLLSSEYYRNVDGNKKLEPMKASHLVLSFDHKLSENNSFRMESYYKDYSSLPLEDSLLNYTNNGNGYAYGFDFIYKGKLPFDIDGWISYGYISTKRKWLDFTKLTRSSFDITHQISLVAKYKFSVMWQIGINYKLASGRPYTPVTSGKFYSDTNIYKPIYGLKNSDRYPVYQRLDLRLTYFNQLFNKFFTVLYIEALNILDIRNIHEYTYSEDYSSRSEVESYFGRRTIVAGTQISF